jgi:fucose permease
MDDNPYQSPSMLSDAPITKRASSKSLSGYLAVSVIGAFVGFQLVSTPMIWNSTYVEIAAAASGALIAAVAYRLVR